MLNSRLKSVKFPMKSVTFWLRIELWLSEPKVQNNHNSNGMAIERGHCQSRANGIPEVFVGVVS